MTVAFLTPTPGGPFVGRHRDCVQRLRTPNSRMRFKAFADADVCIRRITERNALDQIATMPAAFAVDFTVIAPIAVCG